MMTQLGLFLGVGNFIFRCLQLYNSFSQQFFPLIQKMKSIIDFLLMIKWLHKVMVSVRKRELAITDLFIFTCYRLFRYITIIIYFHLYGFNYSFLVLIIFQQIYFLHRWDPNRYYHSKSEWT